MRTDRLLTSATSVGAGASFPMASAPTTVQATVEAAGAVSATVVVEVNNDGANWLPAITFSLSGFDSVTDGLSMHVTWNHIRAHVLAISGTGAAVTVVANGGA